MSLVSFKLINKMKNIKSYRLYRSTAKRQMVIHLAIINRNIKYKFKVLDVKSN